MNDDDTDIKSRVVGERQRKTAESEMSGGSNIIYSYIQFSDRSHESPVPNTGQPWEPKYSSIGEKGKEGSVFSGSKARDVIRQPPAYLGQKGI